MEKAPYKLVIHTDSYTGNFERELVAYSLGILDEEQESIAYAEEYIKAFWNTVVGKGINNLKDYIDSKESRKRLKEQNDYLNNFLQKVDILLGNSDMTEESLQAALNKKEELTIDELYDKYLCYTEQTVDDWEQSTFYNITSHYTNKKYNCDSVIIQLKEIPPEDIEKIIIGRIKGFFEYNVYNIFENYIYLCHYGNTNALNKSLNLLSIDLLDENDNVVKNLYTSK